MAAVAVAAVAVAAEETAAVETLAASQQTVVEVAPAAIEVSVSSASQRNT